MQKSKITYSFLALFTMVTLVSCTDNDDGMMVDQMPTCEDGILNGNETGIDCGGSCMPCDAMGTNPDFSGTYAQVDFMGRPGINTVLSVDGATKDAHNGAIPSEMGSSFQPAFEARLEQYHDVYAVKLGLDPAAVNYENNILGLDATTLTTVLAADVLQVAPDLPTTYFDPGTDLDNDGRILVPDGDEVALTGRRLTDDIIDVSLILLFGGTEGNRFSGQDIDMDGTPDLPRLTSDGVSLTAEITTEFPYIGNPE